MGGNWFSAFADKKTASAYFGINQVFIQGVKFVDIAFKFIDLAADMLFSFHIFPIVAGYYLCKINDSGG